MASHRSRHGVEAPPHPFEFEDTPVISSGRVLGAARDILDRTGYKAPAHTEWDVIPPIGVVEGWVDQLLEEEADRLDD